MSDLNAPIDIRCLNCQREFTIKFDDLRGGKAVKCPHCGRINEFEGDDLPAMGDAAIKKAQKD